MSFNEKQIQIIETAEMLFATRGFDGTSVRDIAEAASINIAMISYYFGSKEKLLEALFELRTGHIKMKVASLLKDDSLSPLEKIFLLIDEHINRAVDYHLFYKIMITEKLVNKNSGITNAVSQLKKRNMEAVSMLIEEGVNKKVFKCGVDVVMMMNTLIGTVSQTVMNQDFYRDYYKQNDIPDIAFTENLKEKISSFLKPLFKSILLNEA